MYPLNFVKCLSAKLAVHVVFRRSFFFSSFAQYQFSWRAII